MPAKKDKNAKKGPPKVNLTAMMTAKGGKPPPPKKPPPPPACFSPDDLARFKELFKEFDEQGIDKVTLAQIPTMLRKLGFNPKGAEIKELFRLFLEDDLVDTVEYHEFLKMIECKKDWGDEVELRVTEAMSILGHDDEEKKGFCDLQLLREELFEWGETFTDIEFVDWIRMANRDKTHNQDTGEFNYVKFIENMNAKDVRYTPEPINYFKLDQKTLAALAMQKAEQEKAEQEQKEFERKLREEAKRQKMIEAGLIIEDSDKPDKTAKPPAPVVEEKPAVVETPTAVETSAAAQEVNKEEPTTSNEAGA